MFAKSLNGFFGSFSLMKMTTIFLVAFIVCSCLRIANTDVAISGENDSVSKAVEKRRLFILGRNVLLALFLLIITFLLINYDITWERLLTLFSLTVGLLVINYGMQYLY